MKLVNLFVCSLFAWPAFASAQISLVRMNTGEISPARGEQVTYTVRIDKAGTAKLKVLTADGDVVREIAKPDVGPGEHQLAWDAKDDRGQTVPDEAYCVQAILEAAAERYTDDPCARTGGEVLSDLKPTLSPNGDIAYALSHRARVLIRVGVKGGAMLRSLSVWRPRPAGRNLQRWNGFDENGIVDLRNERLALLATAFRLPDFTVLTTGQDGLEYRSYRLSRGWAENPDTPPADSVVQPLERNGQRIARQHYMARYKDKEPRIAVTLAKRDGSALDPSGRLPDEVRVSVDLHPDDRWLLEESLYEVAFFVDGDFVSEEENGYVPIGWIWNTASLPAGSHQLTVNLTGFTGRVGTRTMGVQK